MTDADALRSCVELFAKSKKHMDVEFAPMVISYLNTAHQRLETVDTAHRLGKLSAALGEVASCPVPTLEWQSSTNYSTSETASRKLYEALVGAQGLEMTDGVRCDVGKAFNVLDQGISSFAVSVGPLDQPDMFLFFLVCIRKLYPVFQNASALAVKHTFMEAGAVLRIAWSKVATLGTTFEARQSASQGTSLVAELTIASSTFVASPTKFGDGFDGCAAEVAEFLQKVSNSELGSSKSVFLKTVTAMKPLAGGASDGTLWKASLTELSVYSDATTQAKETIFKLSFPDFLSKFGMMEKALAKHKSLMLEKGSAYTEGTDPELDEGLGVFRLAATTRCEGRLLKLLGKKECEPELVKAVNKALTKEVATLAQLCFPVDSSAVLPAISQEIAGRS